MEARLRIRKRYFWLTVTIGIIAIVNSIVFLIWRHDKPHSNPGGPLASMGTAVVIWEVSEHVLLLLPPLIVSIGYFRHPLSK